MEGLIFTGLIIWGFTIMWAADIVREPEVWEPLPAIPSEDLGLRARLEAR